MTKTWNRVNVESLIYHCSTNYKVISATFRKKNNNSTVYTLKIFLLYFFISQGKEDVLYIINFLWQEKKDCFPLLKTEKRKLSVQLFNQFKTFLWLVLINLLQNSLYNIKNMKLVLLLKKDIHYYVLMYKRYGRWVSKSCHMVTSQICDSHLQFFFNFNLFHIVPMP